MFDVILINITFIILGSLVVANSVHKRVVAHEKWERELPLKHEQELHAQELASERATTEKKLQAERALVEKEIHAKCEAQKRELKLERERLLAEVAAAKARDPQYHLREALVKVQVRREELEIRLNNRQRYGMIEISSMTEELRRLDERECSYLDRLKDERPPQ